MIIRKAQQKDASTIAEILLIALKDIIYQFIGVQDYKQAKAFLEHFIKSNNNQYTYQHCYVLIKNKSIVAAAVVYDGAKLHELRDPIFKYIKKEYNINIQMVAETQAGEFYLDSIAVDRAHQGKSIGTKLLQFLINKYVHQQKQTLGLLVDDDNLTAKKWYLRMGFKMVNERILLGNPVSHLQFEA